MLTKLVVGSLLLIVFRPLFNQKKATVGTFSVIVKSLWTFVCSSSTISFCSTPGTSARLAGRTAAGPPAGAATRSRSRSSSSPCPVETTSWSSPSGCNIASHAVSCAINMNKHMSLLLLPAEAALGILFWNLVTRLENRSFDFRGLIENHIN